MMDVGNDGGNAMLLLVPNAMYVVEQGVFRGHMEVRLLNDDPVTILLDADAWAE